MEQKKRHRCPLQGHITLPAADAIHTLVPFRSCFSRLIGNIFEMVWFGLIWFDLIFNFIFFLLFFKSNIHNYSILVNSYSYS
jgi:hypothetical protein